MFEDIKEYVNKEKNKLKKEIARENEAPHLGIIQVGSDKASSTYVRNKVRDCMEVGIDITHSIISVNNSSYKNILNTIKDFTEKDYDGIMIQKPLPRHIVERYLDSFIPAEKDVDGFVDGSKFTPCTALGIVKYLEYKNYQFEGKKVVIIGRSKIVGRSLAKLLIDKNCTVTLCHSKTKDSDLKSFVQSADLIICAVGQEKFLDCKDIKGLVIDVGINYNEEGKLVGDCYNGGDNVSPVPGGVGLLTRLGLLQNVWTAYRHNKHNKLNKQDNEV